MKSVRIRPATGDKECVPPISMMAIVGYTHTQAPIAAAADRSLHTEQQHGAFAVQRILGRRDNRTHRCVRRRSPTTRLSPCPGCLDAGRPVRASWNWDNTDIRYANTASIGPLDVIYGITANNNPTVQDVWNTTPAWAFPYAVSTLAPTPAARTLIEGAFAAHVVGVGAYAFINDMLYLELTGYRTLDFERRTRWA